jgi:uridine phosphorylase
VTPKKKSRSAPPKRPRAASKPASKRTSTPGLKSATKAAPRAAPKSKAAANAPRILPSVVPVRFPLPERVCYAYPSLFFHALQETLGASDMSLSRFGLGRALVKPRGETKVGLVRGALGSPAASIILEDAIAAGAREILAFGSAIALSPQVGIGDLVLPTEAVSGEGTSGFYLPRTARRAPDAGLRQSLARVLDRSGARYRVGRVGTTDALYRQTPDRIQAYRKARLLALETELAALFAVAKSRGVRIVSLLVVSDSIAGDGWEQGSDRPMFLNAVVSAAASLSAWVSRSGEENHSR